MRKQSWLQRLALCWLISLGTVALLADFIANDRPLVASVDGDLRFPILHEYGLSLGLVDRYDPLIRNWKRTTPPPDWAIWPAVPYSAGGTDLKNANYRSPFDQQDTGRRARHYLGTDDLGRDVFAGLIGGTRVAIFVGIGSVFLSLLLGIPLGGVAGFFGNDQLRAPRYHWWGWTLGGCLGIGYAFINLFPFFGATSWLMKALLIILSFCLAGLILRTILRFIPFFQRPMNYPADTLILQGIELFVTIPPLVLLIALLAIINRPSIGIVVVVIGVLRWPFVARHLRAELLRIRQLPYIEAAYVSGLSRWRILFRHALPNALGPLIVVSSFGLGGAILLESFISFLGIGIPADAVTWGSLLRQSRTHPTAWWMAVFPGLMLTLTVLAVNVFGERK